MKQTFLLILIMLKGIDARAQASIMTSFFENNGASLFEVLPSVITSGGGQVQDVAWPGYRLMDANGVLKTLSDVTGPYSPSVTYSISNQITWSVDAKLKLQTRYADFNGTCDLNNPSEALKNEANLPPINHGNGLVSIAYQSGTFNSCDRNTQYSQGNFSPLPYLTRSAWLYRACRMITVKMSSSQLAQLVNRIQKPDPTPNINGEFLEYQPSRNGTPPPTQPPYDWCSNINYPSSSDYQKLFRAFYPGRTIPQQYVPERNMPSISKMATLSYKEKLMDVASASDAFINTLSYSDYQSLETNCASYGVKPTLEKVKAANAWRAILLTMCIDPGWNIQ